MDPKVFVGNLDFATSADELRTLFSQAGEVVDVSVPTDRESGRPRGFAFVEFSSDEAASKAIEKFNGQELNGRALRVNEAGERPPRTPGFRPGGFGSGPGAPPPGGDRFRPRPKGSRRNLRSRKRSIW